MNLITKPTELALKIIGEYISPGDLVVDATAGNGYDTLALAKKTGAKGKVYSFDIQQTAIDCTKTLLEQEGFFHNCILVLDSHHHMEEHIPENEHGKLSVVIFNLGYLPGGEKSRTTESETTLPAVMQALKLVKPGGLVAVTMYGGHPAGKEEKEILLRFARALPQKEYHAAYLSLINQESNPPELLLLTKK